MAKAHPATIVASLTVPKRVLLFCLASDHDWVKAGVGWNRPRLHCVLDFGQMGLALQHGHRVRRRWIAPFDVKLATEKSTERDSQIIPNQRQWMPASQGGKSMLSLKTMTVSKLKVLKREVEAAIHAKVTERRHEIESELSKLCRLDGGGRGRVVRAAAIRGDAAKYRNSEPTLKAGRKNESLLAKSPKASAPKQPKKTKKVRKTRNAGNIAKARLSTLFGAEHVETLAVETLPIEPVPVPSIYANDIPADLGASAYEIRADTC